MSAKAVSVENGAALEVRAGQLVLLLSAPENAVIYPVLVEARAGDGQHVSTALTRKEAKAIRKFLKRHK